MANGDMQGMGMMAKMPQADQMPKQEQAAASIVNMDAFQKSVSNLSDKSSKVLEQHLTPPVKEAIVELFGRDVAVALKDFGPKEPTVNIPVSAVVSAYPSGNVEDSVQMMAQDFKSKAQQNIPSSPQGGLGGEPMKASPQTNVPPSPMPTGMV